MNLKIDPIFSIFSLVRCANGLNRERAKVYGLNDIETNIIIHIGFMEKPSQKNISDKFGAPKQTVNNIIKNLRDEGLIDQIQDEDDKRIRILRFTEKGKKVRDERLKPFIESNVRMKDRLGDEKLREIKDALTLLISTIKEELKEEK